MIKYPKNFLEVHFMRSIITVVGKDTVGILAEVSMLCAKHSVNIIEVTQSIYRICFV